MKFNAEQLFSTCIQVYSYCFYFRPKEASCARKHVSCFRAPADLTNRVPSPCPCLAHIVPCPRRDASPGLVPAQLSLQMEPEPWGATMGGTLPTQLIEGSAGIAWRSCLVSKPSVPPWLRVPRCPRASHVVSEAAGDTRDLQAMLSWRSPPWMACVWWWWTSRGQSGWLPFFLSVSVVLRIQYLEQLTCLQSEIRRCVKCRVWISSLWINPFLKMFCCTNPLLPSLFFEIPSCPPLDFSFCFPLRSSLKLAFLGFFRKPSCSPHSEVCVSPCIICSVLSDGDCNLSRAGLCPSPDSQLPVLLYGLE